MSINIFPIDYISRNRKGICLVTYEMGAGKPWTSFSDATVRHTHTHTLTQQLKSRIWQSPVNWRKKGRYRKKSFDLWIDWEDCKVGEACMGPWGWAEMFPGEKSLNSTVADIILIWWRRLTTARWQCGILVHKDQTGSHCGWREGWKVIRNISNTSLIQSHRSVGFRYW